MFAKKYQESISCVLGNSYIFGGNAERSLAICLIETIINIFERRKYACDINAVRKITEGISFNLVAAANEIICVQQFLTE